MKNEEDSHNNEADNGKNLKPREESDFGLELEKLEASQLKASYESTPSDTRFRDGLRMIYLGGLLGDNLILKYGNEVMDRFRK